MDKSVPPPKQKTMIRNGVAEQSFSSEFIVHELLNELPIINLCCFKVRAVAKRAGDNLILVKLDRMEKAVAGVRAQVEGDSCAVRGEKRRNTGQANPPSHYRNVYSLFNAAGVADSLLPQDYAMQTSIPN